MTEFHPLPARARTLIRLRSGVLLGFVALVVAVFAGVALDNDAEGAGIVLLIALAAAVGVWWVWTGLLYRSYGWSLSESTVELRYGVVVHRHLVLPRPRVQNVTQTAGPVARWAGLASVVVHSAGANTPNIRVPDVTAETGTWLRASLLPSGAA